jgi:hypothetical protein
MARLHVEGPENRRAAVFAEVAPQLPPAVGDTVPDDWRSRVDAVGLPEMRADSEWRAGAPLAGLAVAQNREVRVGYGINRKCATLAGRVVVRHACPPVELPIIIPDFHACDR